MYVLFLSGYDSGDCCECTCVSTADHTCGADGGYLCLDPSAPCVDDDDVTITIISTEGAYCLEVFVADGDCDDVNNNADCGASRSGILIYLSFGVPERLLFVV